MVSVSSLVVGVAAGGATPGGILLTGVAGLIAGALSMAAGEYISVQAQADHDNRYFADFDGAWFAGCVCRWSFALARCHTSDIMGGARDGGYRRRRKVDWSFVVVDD